MISTDAVWPYLAQINAPAAWPYATGDGVTVAVIDTGVGVTDTCDHGTGVAGVVVAVAPAVRLVVIKAVNADCQGTVSQLADGITDAVEQGAQIIVITLGLAYDSPLIAAAVEDAAAQGVLVIASAGNLRSDAPFYPAAYPDVMGVGGVDGADTLSATSDWGYSDLVAPSVAVTVPSTDGGWLTRSGTSWSAPQVAGVAALVLSRHPELGAAGLRALLMATAHDLGEPGVDALYGAGLVDAFAAVADGLPRMWLPLVEASIAMAGDG